MAGADDDTITALLSAGTPPLSHALRVRTLAMARANLAPPARRAFLRAFAEYAVPAPLVPALLVSAAVVFAIDALGRLARFPGLF